MASRKLIATAIVTVLSASSFIGIGSQLVDSQNAEPAKASSSISDTVYLELNSNYWGNYPAYYTIHYWGGDSSSSWPGANFNDNNSASGNAILKATWDTSSTHVMIMRWSDSSHTTEWNRWEYFNANSFAAGSYNYFQNDVDSNCASSLVYENSGDVYFSNADGWANVYAYAYNATHTAEMGLGTWPGTLISDISSDITFDSCSGLYHLAIDHLIDDTIIFNSGAGSQTANLNITLGADSVYFKTDYLSSGDAIRGAAANFVYDLNTTRLAVSANGDVKDASICGISTLDATSICQSYNALSTEAKGYINASSIYTYTNQSSSSADANISVSSIMSQLSLISGVSLSSRITFANSLSNSYSILLTGLICVMGILTIGGFYLLKKKKAN